MSNEPLSAGQALGRWFLYLVIFLAAGGVAAGGTSLIYRAIAQTQTPLGIYAVIFAASGFIAYRLAQRVYNTPER